MPVAVVTDSTAYLPEVLATGVTVVPLTVVINGRPGVEGEQVGPAEVAAALAEPRTSVTTSRPAPAQFASAFQRLLAAGADGVVAVHLSAHLSGTYEAAVLAADEVAPDQITVVDSGATGMGLGFCALAAAEAAASGAGQAAVAAAARLAAAATTTYFYVDTLEFLRRGGRISAASALLGTALSVKPILHVTGGVIAARDKVRTASRALERLVDLSVAAAEGDGVVDLAVHHLAAPARAEAVSDAITARLGPRLRHHWTSEVGAVVAAHAGPGLVGVVVHRIG
ncbi:DegV family protein [Natronosporangium hydrolyticum]|uniref:DegV family protein n=1 Tax=Natronosporangium hydrolyticum TaxID=2811111 RepID=A0A895YE74_9ACTN|nr:DegV family protein [Natronosporangium hydrolyticum]QSB16087.1 DegV family protein [Natronosporangium hydrolyticum]